MKRILTAVKCLTALALLVAFAITGAVLLPAPACFVPFFGVIVVFVVAMERINAAALALELPPKPKQGKPVDRVLFHHFHGGEWSAGESWTQKGRGYTVSLIRQGLDELLHEECVDTYRPVYELGFTAGEDGKEKAVDALRKQIERRDATIDRQSAELERLRRELAQRPKQVPAPTPAKPDVYTDVLVEWGRTEKDVDEILRERGLQRIPKVEPEPVHIPEPVTEPEPVMLHVVRQDEKEAEVLGELEPVENEPEETTVDRPTWATLAERNELIKAYYNGGEHTHPETARYFGISESLSKKVVNAR